MDQKRLAPLSKRDANAKKDSLRESIMSVKMPDIKRTERTRNVDNFTVKRESIESCWCNPIEIVDTEPVSRRDN